MKMLPVVVLVVLGLELRRLIERFELDQVVMDDAYGLLGLLFVVVSFVFEPGYLFKDPASTSANAFVSFQ